MTAIVITIINIALVGLNFLIYRRTKKVGVNPNLHSLPVHTQDGHGVVIENKQGKPVAEFKKELQ
ncbi:MAG: hypothetical protein AB3N16_07975 [Flavobacteriaceae bacterium]